MGKKNRNEKNLQKKEVQTGMKDSSLKPSYKKKGKGSSSVEIHLLPLMATLSGGISLIFFFIPWYRQGNQEIDGMDLWKTYANLPEKVQDAFSLVGGKWFSLVLLVAIVGTIGAGITGTVGYHLFPRVTGKVIWVLSFLNFWISLLLFNVLWNQQVRPYVETGGMILVGTISLSFLFFALELYRLDQKEVEEREKLLPWEWAVLLSGVTILTLFHFLILCYKIIVPAPLALQDILRKRFRY
jgi:hypothetical protein